MAANPTPITSSVLPATRIVLPGDDLYAVAGISSAQRRELENPNGKYYDPTFPRPVVLTPRTVGYLHHELVAWIMSRPRAEPETRTAKTAAATAARKAKAATKNPQNPQAKK